MVFLGFAVLVLVFELLHFLNHVVQLFLLGAQEGVGVRESLVHLFDIFFLAGDFLGNVHEGVHRMHPFANGLCSHVDAFHFMRNKVWIRFH